MNVSKKIPHLMLVVAAVVAPQATSHGVSGGNGLLLVTAEEKAVCGNVATLDCPGLTCANIHSRWAEAPDQPGEYLKLENDKVLCSDGANPNSCEGSGWKFRKDTDKCKG